MLECVANRNWLFLQKGRENHGTQNLELLSHLASDTVAAQVKRETVTATTYFGVCGQLNVETT